MRRSFSAGGPTSCRATAATISSRSRRLTSSRRSSAPAAAVSLTAPVGRQVLVRIERLLRRTQASGTCCRFTRTRVQVRKRPRIASTSTSAGLQMRAGLRMALPSIARNRRAHRLSPARGRFRSADALGVRRRDGATRGRLARLLAVVRRPRRVALPFFLLARRELEERLERARRARRSPAWRSPIAAKRAGIVRSVKSAGSHASTSSQASGADTRASGLGRTEYAAATVRSLAFWL